MDVIVKMGTIREFNYILKINKLEKEIREDIKTKGAGVFVKGKKEGLRDYPDGVIPLYDVEGNAFAFVQMKQKVEYDDRMTGYTFVWKREMNDKEKEVFTNYYNEFYSK